MKFSAMFFVLCVAFSSFAFAKPKKMNKPDWYPAPRAVYSLAEYLVTEVPGSGNSEEQAKNAAVHSLASYVSTQVESKLQTQFTSEQQEENGRLTQNKQTTNVSKDITATTNVKLYALETTDAYYDKATKTWYVCAFINREKAFEMIKSEIDICLNSFYGFYNKAKIEKDVFSSIRQYEMASREGKEFLKKASYASLFNEKQVNETYKNDKKTASEVESVIKNLKVSNPLSVTVQNDTNNAIFAAVSSVFKDLGWSVSDKPKNPYLVTVTVDDGIVQENKGENPNGGGKMILYTSSIGNASLSIKDAKNDSVLYTFSASRPQGKISAYTEQKVKNKVCASLSNVISEQLANDFENFMLGGE